MRSYILGWIVGAALGLAIAVISLASIGAHGNQLLGLFLIGLCVIAPLAVLLSGIWIYYLRRDKGQTPLSAQGIMWGPALLAACIVPISDGIEGLRRSNFDEEHPIMHEIHVNLTGEDLWLDTTNASGANYYRMPMRGDKPEKFVEWYIYPTAELVDRGTLPYDGSRLKQGITSLYRYTGSVDDKMAKTIIIPIAETAPYPDTDRLASILGFQPGHDAKILVHQYYHYRDHIDVAPALAQFAVTQHDRLVDQRQAVFKVHAANLGQLPIVRLEINGQAMSLGDAALSVPLQCERVNTTLGEAIFGQDQPLRLRWQTSEHPYRWHEANVVIPRFYSHNMGDEKTRATSLILYFTAVGDVFAERLEEVDLPDKKLGVRTTGLPEGMTAVPPCGTAVDVYNPAMVRLLPR